MKWEIKFVNPLRDHRETYSSQQQDEQTAEQWFSRVSTHTKTHLLLGCHLDFTVWDTIQQIACVVLSEYTEQIGMLHYLKINYFHKWKYYSKFKACFWKITPSPSESGIILHLSFICSLYQKEQCLLLIHWILLSKFFWKTIFIIQLLQWFHNNWPRSAEQEKYPFYFSMIASILKN